MKLQMKYHMKKEKPNHIGILENSWNAMDFLWKTRQFDGKGETKSTSAGILAEDHYSGVSMEILKFSKEVQVYTCIFQKWTWLRNFLFSYRLGLINLFNY